MRDNGSKWCFIALAIIFAVMFVSRIFESKYDKEIVVACYESGKLDCEKLNK